MLKNWVPVSVSDLSHEYQLQAVLVVLNRSALVVSAVSDPSKDLKRLKLIMLLQAQARNQEYAVKKDVVVACWRMVSTAFCL